MKSSEHYVTFRGGLTVPLEPWHLVLDLEARGVKLEAAGGNAIVATPKALLTDEDRINVRRWRTHILALLAYQPPTPEWLQ